MANQLVLCVEQLKAALGDQDPRKASQLIEAISQYFDDRISQTEIDLAIDRAFNVDGGVLGFLKLSIKANKLFKKENAQIFALYVKIIELHTKNVIRYAVVIVDICLQYINSFQTSAFERENAAAVIQELVSNNLCESVDRSRLMTELFRVVESKSVPGKLLRRIYELIGVLAKDYPDCIVKVEDGIRIRDMFFKTLENVLLNQHEVNFPGLIGALNGLSNFLHSFMPSIENEAAERIYKCIKKLSDPPEGAVQRLVYRCALSLLATHSALFATHFLDDFQYWHNLLVRKWLVLPWEDRKVAINLLHAFHRQISAQLLTASTERGEEILKFFIKYFKATLESPKSQAYEIRIAILGFGLMAAPCKKLLLPERLTELLSLVMQRTESAANAVSAHNKEHLEHFPDYVQALSQIMEHISLLSGIQLVTLQNIIVASIRQFHFLSTAHHTMTVHTLIATFHNLLQLGDTVLDDVLEKVLYQGVIWTCSHKLPFDAHNDWETTTDWKEQITYESYLPLWNGLLSDTESSSFNRPLIVSKIYDHMMRTLFKILDKLNLSTQKRVYRDEAGNDQELFFCDPNYDLEPERPKDFHIFFNLVDFYRAILRAQPLKSHKDNFLKWINEFIEVIILKSIKNPLVSGFLKLMQTALSITNQLNYFNNNVFIENSQIYNNVLYYLKVTMSKAEQSTGELQLACLKVLFTAPASMLEDFIVDMIPAFVMAFEIGRSNLNLFIADMALRAIERYMGTKSRTSDELKTFLKEILPHFDPYLQGFKSDSSATTEIVRKRAVNAKRSGQKLLKVSETDLLKFQKRIILFLGQLEPEHCLYLVKSEENVNLIKWDVTQTVCLTLYGPNFNPKIYLDVLMPRICQIAISATDRQKKMAACEIVHAVILYLIGTYNHQGKLWSEVCERMLLLGCDGDVGVQQMFEPLIIETMHYMSRNDQLGQKGVEILLDCLMDAISHPTNSAVRDLSAKSLREFLVWTIKQSTPEQLAASPFNIATLIEKLKLFSMDSLQVKRFGAALAFNNVYRVIREEETLVNKYWLDLLHVFCINFIMSENYGHQSLYGQPNLEQVSATLDHIVRVLRERKNIFNAISAERVKPKPFRNALLKDAVLWIFSQCRSVQFSYRHKMMEIFQQLVTCIDGYNSAASFVLHTQSMYTIIELCEGTADGIAAKPNLNHIKQSPIPIAAIHAWLLNLWASLDCYIWLIESNLIANPVEVFNKSIIFSVLRYYIDNVLNANMFNLLSPSTSSRNMMAVDSGDEDESLDYDFSFAEIEKINSAKSSILLQIFYFLNKLLPMGNAFISADFWQSNELISIIIQSIFVPQSLECDMKNPEILLKLPQRLESLIATLDRFAPPKFKAELYKQLTATVIEHYTRMANTSQDILSFSSISTSQVNRAKGIDLVCRLIKNNGIKFAEHLHQFMEISASKVLYELFDGVKEQILDDFYVKKPLPDSLRFANQLLRISFYKSIIYIELIDLLLNSGKLKFHNASTQQQHIMHGKYFFDLYKTSIYEYFMKSVDMVVDRFVGKLSTRNILYIIRILIELAEYAYKYESRNLPKMKLLTNALLGKWSTILEKSKNVDETATTIIGTTMTLTLELLDLMAAIAMICPFELCEITKKAVDFETWLLHIIGDKNMRLDIKSQAIFLLPCVVGVSAREHLGVQSALETLQSQHFPLHSAEFREGSIERAAFENAFHSVLDALCASKSPIILSFLINCTAADSKHIMDYRIADYLQKFIGSLHSEEQLNCLNIPYDLFATGNLEATVRMSILRRFLLTLTQCSSLDAIIRFYRDHIRDITKWCDCGYGLGMTEWNLQQAFVTRIGAFELIETMMAVVPKQHIVDKNCPIAMIDGTELIQWIPKKAIYLRSEVFSTENKAHMELFRKYQCAAYKAICATVSNTKTELKFYEGFLFRETPDQGKFIWKNLIDTSDDNLYTDLALEVDKNPKIKERIVSIRRLKESNGHLNPKYVNTQNIFDSSLSQDVTKIDLSYSTVRTPDEVAQRQWSSSSSAMNHFTLEKNSVNDHEVMASLCAVIEHMFVNGITPISEDGEPRRRAPKWVQNVCVVIENDRVHKNIRIFLATMIDNCRQWFRHYAPTVTKSILRLLVSECYGQQINAFVIFMCVDLLEWDEVHRIQSQEEISLASDLIKILMQRAWHERRDIFRKHLEIIRSLVEKWRELIILPRQLLFDSIRRSNNLESNENICGIQLNGIVLANELIPWGETTRIEYLKALNACLENKSARVYQPASQVLGMAINVIMVKRQMANEQDAQFVEMLLKRLDNISKVDTKKFTDILYGIHKHYEPIVDKFITRIGSLISCTTAKVKQIYLEMFLSRITIYEQNVFREVVAININELLRSHEYQLLALHIINKVLAKMNAIEIRSILPDISTFVDSKKSDCRDVMYEIMIFIRENVKDAALHKTTSAILLNGLNDVDMRLQNVIFNYWSKDKQLPAKLSDRILVLFRELYDRDSEQHFLGYCAQLLLEPAINSADSKQKILQYRHENDSKFTEYDINVNWKTQNSLLRTPLFTESQQKQIIGGEIAPTHSYLRATVNSIQFDPTLEPSLIHQASNSFSLDTQSSLLFNVQPKILDRRSQRIENAANALQSIKKPERSAFQRLRERVVRDKDQLNRAMALKASERKEYKRVVQAQREHSKEGHVTLYRRYRFGDYPDFLINSLAFLLPLQALIKCDALLARQALVTIFSAIYKELGPDQHQFTVTIGNCIREIFSQSKNCESMLFSALVEITLNNAVTFDVDATTVATISNANNMMANGILLLEDRLNTTYMTGRAMTSSTLSIDKESVHWLKLANMYYGLSEYDIVAGIFSEKIDSDRRLPQAIECESNGDYPSALKLYMEIITRNNDTTLIEGDFAYQSYYNCYVKMGRWSDLKNCVADQIDDAEEFWTDEWNREHLLPHYVRSELRVLLCRAATNRVFIDNIEQWLRNPERVDYIKMNFAEALMMLHIANKDYLQARVYSEKYFDRFLNDWRNTSVLSTKVRTNKILDIRRVAEIHTYSNLLLQTDVNRCVLNEFVGRWDNTQMHKTDSIQTWESLITYRRFICELVASAIDPNDSIASIAATRLTESVYNMHFKLVDIALKQNHIELSNTILNKIKPQNIRRDNNVSKRLAQWGIANSKYLHLKCRSQQAALSKEETLRKLLDVWTQIDEVTVQHKAILDANPDIQINALEQITNVAEHTFEMVSSIDVLEPSIRDQLIEHTEPSEKHDIYERIYDYLCRCLKQTIALAERCEQSQSKIFSANFSITEFGIGESYNRLAMFCHQYVGNERIESNSETERLIIVSVLRGMQHNSKSARLQFPRLLQLTGLENMNLSTTFNEEMSRVPVWMFIIWIPQILSRFNFKGPCSLDELVVRLATTYPSSITYTFRLSYAQFQENEPMVPIRATVQRILDAIRNPMVENFTEGIKCLSLPEKVIAEHFDTIHKSLNRMNHYTNAKYRKQLDICYSQVFANKMRGKVSDKLALFKYGIEEFRELDVDANKTQIIQQVKEFLRQLRTINSLAETDSPTMATFCPWLQQLHWCIGDNFIELPGQYTGEMSPSVNAHIKIIKFNRNIEIFKSLRKPMKITILCSDGKSYDFLVKFGEDLRQDQRIQQLFTLMSEQLSVDKNCCQQNLTLRTYKVIPIDPYCGMLSWLENTESILSFLQKYSKNFTDELNQAIQEEYVQFVTREKRGHQFVQYGASANYYTVDAIASNYENLQKKMSASCLRDALYAISASPECFFALRNNFATSLAAMNISNWILGIGDRHTQNLLIDKKNGRIVGVDFGHAFGTATRNLPIPELIPFRLTPQFVNALSPLGTSGLLKKCMVHTLRTFRSERKLLMACMEVFIYEPTINWLDSLDRNTTTSQNSIRSTDSHWEPKLRIKEINEKLLGVNPKKSIEEDLKSGYIAGFQEYLDGYLKILAGRSSNIRNQIGEKDLSADDQVACLIDIATDPGILGIMFTGFKPWI